MCNMFSFRDLFFLTEGTLVNVQEDILVHFIGLQTMREVSFPPAISISLLRGFSIHLWNTFMLATFMDFQPISGNTLKVADVA